MSLISPVRVAVGGVSVYSVVVGGVESPAQAAGHRAMAVAMPMVAQVWMHHGQMDIWKRIKEEREIDKWNKTAPYPSPDSPLLSRPGWKWIRAPSLLLSFAPLGGSLPTVRKSSKALLRPSPSSSLFQRKFFVPIFFAAWIRGTIIPWWN